MPKKGKYSRLRQRIRWCDDTWKFSGLRRGQMAQDMGIGDRWHPAVNINYCHSNDLILAIVTRLNIIFCVPCVPCRHDIITENCSDMFIIRNCWCACKKASLVTNSQKLRHQLIDCVMHLMELFTHLRCGQNIMIPIALTIVRTSIPAHVAYSQPQKFTDRGIWENAELFVTVCSKTLQRHVVCMC